MDQMHECTMHEILQHYEHSLLFKHAQTASTNCASISYEFDEEEIICVILPLLFRLMTMTLVVSVKPVCFA